jgi:branched-chain amino acid transport system permease protein
VRARASVGCYLRSHAGYLVLVLVVMTIPAYLGSSYYLGILGNMATQFMMLLGLSLLVGQAGQISLGQAGFVGIGGYGSAILTTSVGLDPWAAMVLAAVLAAVIAGLVGMPTLRLKGYYLAMATLGVNEIIYVLLKQLKTLTNGTDGISGIPSLSIGGLNLGTPRAYHFVAWGIALVMLLISLNISRSRVGRSLRALRQSEPAAQSLGIDTSYRKVQVFVVAAVFASLAGSLDAYHIHYIEPNGYNINVSIILIAGVIIGGLRSIWGALWGTIVIVILREVLSRLGLEDLANLMFGVLMIALMVLWYGDGQGVWRRVKGWIPSRGSGDDSRRGAEE